MINLPKNVLSAISMLENAGFEAFAVGGAVRDSLLGKEVNDFDITTSALPEETKRVFCDFNVIETGIKHGTVTVVFDGEPLEITTYRIDGEYADNRHPENVTFTRNIEDDLARRDFTVNALAYNPKIGMVDPFGGVDDLNNGVIRAVGVADKRFSEDALRILRCVRFASTLDFEIEKDTAESAKRLSYLLENVSKERIFSELKKLVCGKNVFKILTDFSEIITQIVPELSSCVGFEQNNKYHIYDVYTHTAKSVSASENNLLVRLALLYHDCGKPFVYSEDEKGCGHFFGHPEKSAELAEKSLLNLKCDNKTLERVKILVKYHDYKLEPNKKSVKKFLTKVSFDEARLIVKVKFGDMSAHAPQYAMTKDIEKEYISLIDEIERDGECVSLKTLVVKGQDLIDLGIPKGKIMGNILNTLLSEVVSEKLPNEKNVLLKRAEEIVEKSL